MTKHTERSLWPKALMLTLTSAIVLLGGLLMLNASQLPRTPGSKDTSLLGMTFFTSTREALAGGGSTVTVDAGLGVGAVMVLAVVAASLLVRRGERRRAQLD